MTHAAYDEATRLRAQLEIERLRRAEEDLTRVLVAGGLDPVVARAVVPEHRDRFEHDEDGRLSVRLPSGGVAPGERGLSMLASHIRARLDAERRDEEAGVIAERKRAGGTYTGFV